MELPMIGRFTKSGLCVLALLILMNPVRAADLHGSGRSVVDGDQFILCESNACADIRLCGIDTPSRGRPKYGETVAALTKLVVGVKVLCRPVGEGSVCDGLSGKTSRGRTIAQCFVQEGSVDVGGALVAAGLGCDRADLSGGYYSKDHPEWRCKQ
jgi:endonuclease YncB( thermonuclease family)